MNSVMKVSGLTMVLVVGVVFHTAAQNYTSAANGSWTTAANWTNTSGWGTTTPPIDGSHGSGTITINHNMTISGNYNTGSATLNINAGKTLTISGTMTFGGGSTVNVSGNLTITGDLVLNSTINILPGGVVTVNGSVYVNNANYLIVGTNALAPPYADLIVKTDLRQQGSGDVTVNRNGRVVVFGNVTDGGGGGTFLTLNDGAEMYVNGNIGYTGGGNSINNRNSVSPYGLYVNGTTTNSGGGASTTANKGNKTTLQTTNVPFYNYISSIPGNPLPVTLMFFRVNGINETSIELTWATASEKNFDYFLIESSIDGTSFSEIGKVQGNGNTSVRHNYGYDVMNPVVGKSYYRLKSVDFDGYTETFNVVSANFETIKSVKVFPNPVIDSKVNIDFNFNPSDDVVISISDLTGMEVLRQSVNGMENLLNLTLESGTYLMKINSYEINIVTRIVVK